MIIVVNFNESVNNLNNCKKTITQEIIKSLRAIVLMEESCVIIVTMQLSPRNYT